MNSARMQKMYMPDRGSFTNIIESVRGAEDSAKPLVQ